MLSTRLYHLDFNIGLARIMFKMYILGLENWKLIIEHRSPPQNGECLRYSSTSFSDSGPL